MFHTFNSEVIAQSLADAPAPEQDIIQLFLQHGCINAELRKAMFERHGITGKQITNILQAAMSKIKLYLQVRGIRNSGDIDVIEKAYSTEGRLRLSKKVTPSS